MTGGWTRGTFLVADQEFRVRLRTGRWRWLLVAWVAVVATFTGLLQYALYLAETPNGVPLFGCLMLFVLALVFVVSPTLTAQSVNGDRERGTLATLQVTALSPSQIAVGKLLAAWAVGLSALALTLPFVGWSVAEGGVGLLRAFVVIVVVAVLIGVVCAVSQALSAMLARTVTSALLAYVAVFTLTVGTIVAFALALPLTTTTSYPTCTDPYDMGCDPDVAEQRTHPDLVWWLLAPNPFVVLADAAPALPRTRDPRTGRYRYEPEDVLGGIGHSVRLMRRDGRDWDSRQDRWLDSNAVWPYGLGFNVLLGAGSLWITIRRLRVPAGRLARGVRIA